jgi:hypothetical protein
MGWHDTLTLLGLELQNLFAGFAGGVVSVFLMRRVTPWEALGSMTAGALAANYLGEVVASLTHALGVGLKLPVACFVTGLSAMALCQGIVEVVKSRIGNYVESHSNTDTSGGKSDKNPP